jgi:hypothetical protein
LLDFEAAAVGEIDAISESAAPADRNPRRRAWRRHQHDFADGFVFCLTQFHHSGIVALT